MRPTSHPRLPGDREDPEGNAAQMHPPSKANRVFRPWLACQAAQVRFGVPKGYGFFSQDVGCSGHDWSSYYKSEEALVPRGFEGKLNFRCCLRGDLDVDELECACLQRGRLGGSGVDRAVFDKTDFDETQGS